MKGLTRVAIALLAMLLVSGILLYSSRQDRTTKPTVSSVATSGLGAFAELLSQDGIDYRVTRDEVPELGANDLAIALITEAQSGMTTNVSPKTVDALERHTKDGGRTLEFRFDPDFETEARTVRAVQATSAVGGSFQVTLPPAKPASGEIPRAETRQEYVLWRTRSDPFVWENGSGKGGWFVVDDAIGATNKFLGEAENAKFFLSLIRRLRPSGGRVVFVESTLGGYESKGLLGTLGPWAVAAQWQAVFLAVVALIGLGARFGLPETQVRYQRSARHLLDSLAEIFRQGKKYEFAAQTVAGQAIEDLRRKLKLPRGTPVQAVLAKVPEDVRKAYELAVNEVGLERKPEDVAAASKSLLDAVAGFRPGAQ